MKKNVSFYSNKVRLSGELYIPENLTSGKKYPAILLCQGLSGNKAFVFPEVAKHFSSENFVCMTFDYQGFGESEGARGFIDLFMRSQDAIEAYRFLKTLSFVDIERMGIYGLSLGGGIASFIAIQEPAIKAVVSVSGFYSGERLLRSLRTASQWIRFKDRLKQNRHNLEKGAKGEEVSLTTIFPFEEEFLQKYKVLTSQDQSSSIPSKKQNPDKWHLESAERILAFNLLPELKKISPRPFLLIHGEKDDVIPIEDAEEAYSHANDIKKLIVFKDNDHIDLDTGPGLQEQITLSLKWFDKHI